jgi:perosamine synthetase
VIPQVSPWLGEEEQAAVSRVLARNWITEGPECEELSARLNKLIDVPFGVFAPNGTLALVLGLMALGIQAGDEVLVPDITFIGSANAVIMLGALPVFVEVDRERFQIDVAKAEKLVNERTRAIMPVHLSGTACNMHAVRSFASRHGLKVIEDAAQAIGVSFDGHPVGGLGDVGCFSFFADKTMTMGEGGYVVCREEATFDRLRYLRNQGRLGSGSYVHPTIGYNFRITDMQAALGLVQLAKLDEIVQRKLELYAEYRRCLAGLASVRVLDAEPMSTFIPFRCVLVAERAADLIRHLNAAGIQTRSFFYPMHKQPCFADLPLSRSEDRRRGDLDFPNAVHGYEHGLSLPIFPTLSKDQVGFIADSIAAFYESEPE